MKFYEKYGKRILDLIVSVGGLVVLSPIFLLIALLVKLTSKGSVIFSQERVGKNGKIFKLYKFRTMIDGAYQKGPPVTSETDPRITPIGRLLRRYKLDELPQLINILLGQMSLVGPRPELFRFVKYYSEEEREVLKVKPGLTGVATLKYRREERILKRVKPEKVEEFYQKEILPKKIQLDREYLRCCTLKKDMEILFKTLLHLLRGEAKGPEPQEDEFKGLPVKGFIPTEKFKRVTFRAVRSRNFRHLLFLIGDIGLIATSLLSSINFIYHGEVPEGILDSLSVMLFIVVLAKVSLFLVFSLYDVGIRSFGLYESVMLFFGNLVGEFLSLLAILLLRNLYILPGIDFRFIPLDFLACLFLLGAARISLRVVLLLKGYFLKGKERALLIADKTDAIVLIKEMLEKNGSSHRKPVALLSLYEDSNGIRVNGIPVYYGEENLERLIKAERITEVVISKSHAASRMKDLITRVKRAGVKKIYIMPSIIEAFREGYQEGQLRSVQIEDLLPREPVSVDLGALGKKFKGKRVLVTGASGSIGSELSWQLTRLGADRIILLDHEETRLFELYSSLKDEFPHKEIVPYLASVLDETRIRSILKSEKPHLIFHAAAYKHVPFLEWNPEEAVKTNVLGSWIVAQSAIDMGVERFVFISTDKAVNPSSLMGATKRLVEILIGHLNSYGKTRFMAVRFGNVLGSRGSVSEIFRRQIESGGPVTITHPDMKRYFMTIGESVLLVIEASLLGKGGEIFILDMGKPVKIIDLAMEMITLAGYRPYVDIPIAIVGPRPGEKLIERLYTDNEILERTSHSMIYKVKSNANNGYHNRDEFLRKLKELVRLAQRGGGDQLFYHVSELVPEYKPSGLQCMGVSTISHTGERR